ncbi:MAG: SURF1 family protein [Sinobacteraceae bacterium]|nr:SURF1 family protein [Nevskiaceae bacterium]
MAGTVAVLFFAIFVALGTWQLKRRVWKLDLIARVDQRVHAPPVAAPGPARWTQVTAANDEYRHVTVDGTFLDQSQTLVQAVTALGAGYWVLTPLRTEDGSLVLVNRGFVAADDRARVQPGSANAGGSAGPNAGGATRASAAASVGSSAGAPAGDDLVHITGLLRITEPGGAFLRHNDPAANRWYSRDVQAIAQARGLTNVAPYFIDADASGTSADASGARADTSGARPVSPAPTSGPGSAPALGAASGPASAVAPVGGLTVITFHNSHLVYAITWYTLALMVVGGMWIAIRNETRA